MTSSGRTAESGLLRYRRDRRAESRRTLAALHATLLDDGRRDLHAASRADGPRLASDDSEAVGMGVPRAHRCGHCCDWSGCGRERPLSALGRAWRARLHRSDCSGAARSRSRSRRQRTQRQTQRAEGPRDAPVPPRGLTSSLSRRRSLARRRRNADRLIAGPCATLSPEGGVRSHGAHVRAPCRLRPS